MTYFKKTVRGVCQFDGWKKNWSVLRSECIWRGSQISQGWRSLELDRKSSAIFRELRTTIVVGGGGYCRQLTSSRCLVDK